MDIYRDDRVISDPGKVIWLRMSIERNEDWNELMELNLSRNRIALELSWGSRILYSDKNGKYQIELVWDASEEAGNLE